MIIYNNNREFIGIDEENLKSLGYPSFTSLLSEAADFADLFVKVPGHVHNFKHVHWIDFILCATDKNSSKAIIHANGKSFSCVLDIKTIYLTSAPTKQSYNITLNNLRALSAEELQGISGELQSRPAPVAAPVTPAPIVEQEPEEEEIEVKTPTEASQSDEIDISEEIDIDKLPELETSAVEQDPYEVEDEFNLDVFEVSDEDLEKIGEAETTETQMTREDLHENLHEHVAIDEDLEETIEEEIPEIVEVEEDLSLATDEVSAEGEGEEDEYVFDIQETADALEMDVATIQDFVNDFIDQAKDFKPKLYEAVEHDDMIELKSLSHQLKGVAANLRIHDAQDILIQINKAEDFTHSTQDLDKFYRIISKLAGEEPEVKAKVATPTPAVEDPIIEEQPADINEETLDIDDIDTPEIDEDALEINDDEDEALEIADIDTPEIDEDALEINDDEEDALEIADIDTPEIDEDVLEINDDEEDALEIADIDTPEIDEDVLEINDDEEDALEIAEDDFDLLDEEQNELIGANQQNDILDEIEELKPAQTYNKMSVANEIGLDEESFNELFEDFSNESKALVLEAQEAIEANDAQKWQHAAVKLKGMSDNMRVTSFKSDIEALITIQDSSDAQKSLNKINETLLSIIETKD
ncbi:Hpt domain-containing protein [Sulfurimonas sp.]|uniref:Hpt domain-containing protein n=1 Tax=Sulfurimonas sp. TaxID=2022749 RepID=UPI00356945BB